MAAMTPLMVLQVPVTVFPSRSVKLTWVPSLLPLQAATASGGGPGGGPLCELPGGGGGMPPFDVEDPDELAACAMAHPRGRTSTVSRDILFDMLELLKIMGHDCPELQYRNTRMHLPSEFAPREGFFHLLAAMHLD